MVVYILPTYPLAMLRFKITYYAQYYAFKNKNGAQSIILLIYIFA